MNKERLKTIIILTVLFGSIAFGVIFYVDYESKRIEKMRSENKLVLSQMKFNVGDIVYHKASGARGIVLNRYPWYQYTVKFSIAESFTNTRLLTADKAITTAHTVEECQEFELSGERINP